MHASDSTAYWRQEQTHCARSPLGYDQRPWTAARCVRLLRPLSSKLSTLERIRKTEIQRDVAAQHLLSQQRDTLEVTGRPEQAITQEIDGWEESSKPEKRIRRTYASRYRSCIFATGEQANCVNGTSNHTSILQVPKQLFASKEASLPETWKRDPAIRQNSSKGDQWSSRKMPRGFQASAMSGKEKLNSGIRSSLEAILKATRSSIDKDKSGSRSLFSTCLRTVPYHMSDEDSSLQYNDPDNEIDVSSATYDDLEEYGSLGTSGYKALREVVRSHGVHLLSDSIAKGLVNPEDASASVQLCVNQGSYDEAETLIKALISLIRSTGREKGLVSIENTKWILQLIQGFVCKTRRYGFQFNCLLQLLEDDKFMNIQRLTGSLSDCWNAAIRSLSLCDDHCESAAALLRTTIRLSYMTSKFCMLTELHEARTMALPPSARPKTGQGMLISHKGKRENTEGEGDIDVTDDGRRLTLESRDADSTASNILTILATIAILQQHERDNTEHAPFNACLSFLTDMTFELSHMLDLDKDLGRRSRMSPDQMALPLLAANMSTPTWSRDNYCGASFPALTGSMLESLKLTEQGKNYAGSFVSAVAQCCQRVIPAVDGFALIRSIVEAASIMDLSAKLPIESSNIRGTIAVLAAHTFCLTSSQPEHIEWAMMMDNKVRRYGEGASDSVLQCTPARGNVNAKDRYRWEEGICEWIVKTPISRPEIADSPGDKIEDKELSSIAWSQQQTLLGSEYLSLLVAPISDVESVTPSPTARRRLRCRSIDMALDRPTRKERRIARSSMHKWQQSKTIQIASRPQDTPRRLRDVDGADELSILSSEESMTVGRLHSHVGPRRSQRTNQGKCYRMKAKYNRSRTFYGSRPTHNDSLRSKNHIDMGPEIIETEDELSIG